MKVLTEIKICNRLYHISYISICILNLKIELPSCINYKDSKYLFNDNNTLFLRNYYNYKYICIQISWYTYYIIS